MISLLMPPDRFDRDRYDVEGDAYRHLFRARRLAAGARLRVIDGRGNARWAEIRRVERRRALLELGAPAPANEPGYRLRLQVAALRLERASWLVEKATEIGVCSMCFTATERAPRTYGEARLERLRRVAAAAVEQCHRALVPEVSGVEPWETATAWLEDPRNGGADRFYLDTGAESSALRRSAGRGVVLVGPEGGWSRAEASALDRLGCRAVSLGPRTLRTETAAVAAAARLVLGS